MTPERFEHLLSVVGPYITHHCKSSRPISASERLCLCLRYLATGEIQSSSSFPFRIGRSTISGIISETCSAIWIVLKSHYMRSPQSRKDWENIEDNLKKNGFFQIRKGLGKQNFFLSGPYIKCFAIYLDFPLNNYMAKTCCCIQRAGNNYGVLPPWCLVCSK